MPPASKENDPFAVQLVNDQSERTEINALGLPRGKIVRRGKKLYKQVLHNVTGFVKPKEMVAIMGPSGCGKTSLLNVLAQRTNLSNGSITEGVIDINGRVLAERDFAKMGAFVQQDDVLMESLTPRELLTFAARIRTNLGETDIQNVVQKIIDRLRLTDCQDTIVGGLFRKSLSGGQKKRVSIGYELVTNPALILMDEPTSGLDSFTALKIC